ncbi:MAG: hypothetical protein ACXWBP_09445 [Limisphaerales bacterium]
MRIRFFTSVLLTCVLAVLAGCRTMKPLPPANLKEPGWTVREGQAVWKRQANAPEIAGEILVATRTDGQAFVQFSKNPFPLVIAQSTPKGWQVETPTENKFHSGHGKPPARLIFLYIPRLLASEPAPQGWTYEKLGDGYKLENHKNGESLEVYFTQ